MILNKWYIKGVLFSFYLMFMHFPDYLVGNEITSDSTNIVSNTVSFKDKPGLKFYNQFLGVDTLKNLFLMNYRLKFVVQPSFGKRFKEDIRSNLINRPIVQQEYDFNTKSFRSKILPSPIKPKTREFKKKSFPFHKYELPTREEFHVLSTLWKKGDITGVDIYSEMGPTLNITFEGLKKILKSMKKRGWLDRKKISPSLCFGFQVQGSELPFGIEMSPKNRRNRVYRYHSNIEYAKMKDFIHANGYLVKSDPSLIYSEKFNAVKSDTNLIQYLYNQIFEINGLEL